MEYVKGMKPAGCILCLINEGSKEVSDLSVMEEEHFIVTVNLYPYNPGHLMIFPRRHIEDVRHFTEVEEIKLQRIVKYMLDVLDEAYAPKAYNIGYNMGLIAGASINHLHMHIIPRYPNEIGIADLIAGKRVLVESPFDTMTRIRAIVDGKPVC